MPSTFTSSPPAFLAIRPCHAHGRSARRRQAGRPDLARRRRAGAARARRAAHRPHRHARSGGDRRAAARARPRDAARPVPERQRQVLRSGRPARLRDRHRATRDGHADRAVLARGPLPSREAIERALDAFRGTFLQQPPAFSAKKIDGTAQLQARACARDARTLGVDRLPAATYLPYPPFLPRRASPSHAIEIVSVEGDCVTLRVDCSAGFYVRSLAHDLGRAARHRRASRGLRRTRSGDFTLDEAVALDAVERDPAAARRRADPAGRDAAGGSRRSMLTAEGVLRAVHGRDLGPATSDEAGRGARRVRPARSGSSGCSIRAGELVGDRRADERVRAFASLRCSDVTC